MRQSTWQLELLRSFSAAEASRKKLEANLKSEQERNRELQETVLEMQNGLMGADTGRSSSFADSSMFNGLNVAAALGITSSTIHELDKHGFGNQDTNYDRLIEKYKNSFRAEKSASANSNSHTASRSFVEEERTPSSANWPPAPMEAHDSSRQSSSSFHPVSDTLRNGNGHHLTDENEQDDTDAENEADDAMDTNGHGTDTAVRQQQEQHPRGSLFDIGHYAHAEFLQKTQQPQQQHIGKASRLSATTSTPTPMASHFSDKEDKEERRRYWLDSGGLESYTRSFRWRGLGFPAFVYITTVPCEATLLTATTT
ncbi:hypothetical protein K402DRAFT_122160 [Aulographum hederae CBS 113979]|uniref:Uncharacterized protein n=1 Tax=Aulographum hederae CBS 113979 TaxID=1176131 RepID=A0A6G1GVG6_9PEZI|nr:hypothetical protein K402DRAFT_122160 [Aulographum hederae CBS 113979]